MNNSKYFFPFFALFVLFADEMFLGFISLSGMGLESGMKSIEAIIIAGIAYTMMIVDYQKRRINKKCIRLIGVLFVILLLYCITGMLYPHNDMYVYYRSHLMVFGSLCIPACYVGMRLSKRTYDTQVINLLPLFLILISLVVSYAVINSSRQGLLMGWQEEDVFNYQNASYYLSYCSAYSVYYVFFNKKHQKSFVKKLLYFLVILLIFLCAIGCVLGGGRGAFVYLVAISAYLAYRILGKNKYKPGYVFALVAVAIIMTFLAIHFDIFHSVGAERVSTSLTSDENREQFYRNAERAFIESPITGNGVGSVWWKVGFYSHNMVADLLVETGLVGTIIIITVLIKILLFLIKRSKEDSFDLFILIVFLGSLLHSSFSGYWFSAFKLFMVLGYVFGMKYSGIRIKRPLNR